MRLVLLVLVANLGSACSARPLALPLPDAGARDLATPDLATPCLLSGRYASGALQGTIDTTSGCAVFSIFQELDGISSLVLDNFPAPGGARLKTNLDLPGMAGARRYTLADLKSGRIDFDDQRGAYWVVGFAADGTATGQMTLDLRSVVGGTGLDPRGRPTFEVHGTLDATMSSGAPGGADLVLHADF